MARSGSSNSSASSSAGKLRGNMDASEYKHGALGLIRLFGQT